MHAIKAAPERMFVRGLPGGGFVAIDVTVDHSLFGHDRCTGVLVVERRVNRAGADSPPLVIGRAVGSKVEAVVDQLLPTAQCNPAIGAALLRHDRDAR